MSDLIKNIAYCERPYEKAIEYGVSFLSDAELLSVILKTGTDKKSVITLSNEILNLHHTYKGLIGINYLTREELKKLHGIGDVKATQILAITEISKRVNNLSKKQKVCFNNPVTIAEYYIDKCRFMTKENTFLMLFNNSHELIKEIKMSEGTVNHALLSSRDVFIEALRYEAVCFVLVHNHPSGNPEPSDADIMITKKIYQAAKILDLSMSDHIIVGNDRYVSLSERGYLNEV